MHGSLDPDERIMTEPTLIEQINTLIEKFEWDCEDDVTVEIGGTAVYEIEGAGLQ